MLGVGMRLTSIAIGVLLLLAGGQASALTLGRARGATLIGQPLELTVPVTVDPGQTDGALCVDADVFHGDSRVEASRVQVSVEPTAQADNFNIRIVSSTLIDEPVVTVYVRAGCSQKSSRRFVLLAEFPGDSPGSATRPSTASALVQPPMVTPADNTSIRSGWAAANEAASAQAPRAKPVATDKPIATKEPARHASATKKSTSPAPKKEKPEEKPDAKEPAKTTAHGKSRLKLDPLENLTERIKSLESSSIAATAPEEASRDSQRMLQLQGDIKALLDQAAKNESSLMVMRERLEKAESERVPMFVVYVLLGLLGVCLAGLALIWSRRPGAGDWHNHKTAADSPEPHTAPVEQQAAENIVSHAAVEQPAPVSVPAVVPAAAATVALDSAVVQPEVDPALDDVDVNLMDMDESSFSKLMGVDKTPKKKPATSNASQRPVAAVAAHDFQSDEIIDIRQQAAFFAKLGKVDEAIEILEAGIRSNPHSSPLLYLDLLEIANIHSLKTDFRQFRDEFQEQFNAHVPEFAMFKDKGAGLNSYPEVQKKLTGTRETPEELSAIESCILRSPQSNRSIEFDLNAFCELLAMHAAVRRQHGSQHVS